MSVEAHRGGHRYWKGRKPIVDDSTPWEHDDRCWYVVAHHPEGLTLEEVGSLQDCTRERIRQIQMLAIAKLKTAAAAYGLTELELAQGLGIDLHHFR